MKVRLERAALESERGELAAAERARAAGEATNAELRRQVP